MAKSEEELKTFLFKVKEESEKAGLKFNIQKTKIMASGPISSVQFSSVTQSCPTLCDPMNCSMPGLPVHHQIPEFNQTHVHWVSDAIQPAHPLLSPSPPAPNPSQHQSLFPISQLFTWGGQSTRVSALASFLPKKSQGWSPSEWTGWISLQSDSLIPLFLIQHWNTFHLLYNYPVVQSRKMG